MSVLHAVLCAIRIQFWQTERHWSVIAPHLRSCIVRGHLGRPKQRLEGSQYLLDSTSPSGSPNAHFPPFNNVLSFAFSIPCQDPSAVDFYDSEVVCSAPSPPGNYNTLSSESVASQPSGCDQPWPYSFYNATEPIAMQSGEFAWAKGGNGRWRRVLLFGNSAIEAHDVSHTRPLANESLNDAILVSSRAKTYLSTLRRGPMTVSSLEGRFPLYLGTLKPDTETIRRLLREEKVPIQGERDRLYLESVDSEPSTGDLGLSLL
ncbi:hypothetical protein BU15DRAFT_68079 [Melanogaster broomeanus]|nr:hypothetical protein BU15DRAFT_68079 [Melanogaster broomeanus]